MLEVINKNEVLVVDSRLVAEELGIQHRTLKDNITKFQSQFEELNPDYVSPHQALIKETSVKNPDGTGGEVYYYLTEPQANFALTLSNNSEKAVEGKLRLIKAFEKAKKSINSVEATVPSSLIDLFKDMQQEMKVLSTRTKRLDELEEASNKNIGCGNVLKAEADNEGDDLVTAFEYLRLKGFGFEQANKLARRASTFSKVGKGNNYEPPKNKKGHLMFEVKYLDEAFLSICNLRQLV